MLYSDWISSLMFGPVKLLHVSFLNMFDAYFKIKLFTYYGWSYEAP